MFVSTLAARGAAKVMLAASKLPALVRAGATKLPAMVHAGKSYLQTTGARLLQWAEAIELGMEQDVRQLKLVRRNGSYFVVDPNTGEVFIELQLDETTQPRPKTDPSEPTQAAYSQPAHNETPPYQPAHNETPPYQPAHNEAPYQPAPNKRHRGRSRRRRRNRYHRAPSNQTPSAASTPTSGRYEPPHEPW